MNIKTINIDAFYSPESEDFFRYAKKRKKLINRYIREYNDIINFDSFNNEYLLYINSIKKLINTMFYTNKHYYGDIIIDKCSTHTVISFSVVELTIYDDNIEIQVYTEYIHTDVLEFKAIYQELLRIESLLDKNTLISHCKSLRMVSDNTQNIETCVFNHFNSVTSENIDDVERELKLKFIELL